MSYLKEKIYSALKESLTFNRSDFIPGITVYEKPACTTCRKVAKILIENGVDFKKVNYYVDPFTKSKLQSLLKKMKMNPSDILRKKEKIYKDLKFAEKNYTEEQVLDLMIK